MNVESMESLSIGANDKQQVTANRVSVLQQMTSSEECSRYIPGCSILKRHVHICRKPRLPMIACSIAVRMNSIHGAIKAQSLANHWETIAESKQ